MHGETLQQTGIRAGSIGDRFELVCRDVIDGIPAKASCRKHGLNYNTFNKRIGPQGVHRLRNEKGTTSTTDAAPTSSSDESNDSVPVASISGSSQSARKGKLGK